MVDTLGPPPPRPGTIRAAAPTAKIFVADQDSEGVIRQSLDDLGIDDVEFTTGTVETAIATLATETSPRLLVVDISDLVDPVSRIDELAERCEPDIGVIVIGKRNDITLYRELKDAGVTEYFFKPLVRDLVKLACNRILTGEPDTAANRRTGKIVFVLGVRGGVGATTIATGAAHHLAGLRQSWVMLVDLDLQHGDAALQLDVSPSHSLTEALEKPDRVDKLFIERGRIHVAERLDLLASLETLDHKAVIAEDAVLSLFGKLSRRYRFIFVDLPASEAVGLMRVLHQPSTCVLISDGSLASARDIVRWREPIGPNTPERKTLHVLNMKGAANCLTATEYARAIGQAPDITIPFDREIAAASNFGVKATQKCEELNRGISRLLRDIAGEPEEPPPSILKRIFG